MGGQGVQQPCDGSWGLLLLDEEGLRCMQIQCLPLPPPPPGFLSYISLNVKGLYTPSTSKP